MKTKLMKTVSLLSLGSLLFTQLAGAAQSASQESFNPKLIEGLFSRAEYTTRVLGDPARAEQELVAGLNSQRLSVADLRQYLVLGLNAQEIAEFDNRVATAAYRDGGSGPMTRERLMALAGPVAASLGERGAHALGTPGSKAGAVLTIVAGVIGAIYWLYNANHCSVYSDSWGSRITNCNETEFQNFRHNREANIRSNTTGIADNNLKIGELQAKMARGEFYQWVDGTYTPVSEMISNLEKKNRELAQYLETNKVALELSYTAEQELKDFRAKALPAKVLTLGVLPAGIVWAVMTFNE